MMDCKELVYERFRIECFPMEAVSCAQNPNVRCKTVRNDDLVVDTDQLYLEVGSFPAATGNRIITDDKADKVNTKVSEKMDGLNYKVSLKFQFEKVDENSITLCTGLNIRPFYFFIRYLGFDGKVVASRFIRNGWGQSVVDVTEEQGVVSVEITVANVSGIQLVV